MMLGLTSYTATAQDAPAEGEIVVPGETARAPEDVRSLVQRLAEDARPDVPATRFFDALCLSVSGLNSAGNDYLHDRIVRNAADIGLPAQGEGCRVNAMVLIFHDVAGLVERIKDEQPMLLPREERVAVDAAVARGDEFIVWHNEEDRNMGGRRLAYGRAVPGDDNVGGSFNVDARININNWPSRAELAFSRGVVSAAIIFDSEIIEGMEIDRLADYATMRLLAPDLIPLDGEFPEPASITAPFPAEGGPERLTRFDRAYLTALYALRPNAPAVRLARAVAEEYEGED